MREYDHKRMERKWQTFWEKSGVYYAQSPRSRAKLATGRLEQKKFYALIEFPYPSGDGLHVGHPRPYIGMDVISRKRRMEGFNVLYPIGWDAFGLPTENYAIKTGKDPRVVTKKNSDNFRRQIKSLGISFDWSREINTTDPKYYKWTQWIFLQFFKKNLAYKKKMEINWCPKDKIGLANEEVVGGACERCGTAVEKREKEQWMLAITKYADRLDKDLDTVDYLPQIKLAQRNWIGKSEGAEVEFHLTSNPSPYQGEGGQRPSEVIKVFTTRPDTIFGATYLVLAPESPLLSKCLFDKAENKAEALQYTVVAKKKSEIERTAIDKAKTGVELKGVKAVNPATKEEIPIWIADYVLPHYGTGAIMGVPAHDERDFEFAKKFGLLIKQVVAPHIIDSINPPQEGKKHAPRKVVQVVVKHWKDNTAIRILWKKFPWKTLVIGGVEEGESYEEAAKREMTEETGYKNFKSITEITPELRSEWYAEHKDENRYAQMKIFLIELKDGDKNEMSEEEKAKHDIDWIQFSKIKESYRPVSELDYIWNGLADKSSSNLVYTGAGILIDSGKFSEMDSEKAKKEIIKFVGGKAKTTFKLRDWVFSRQRYWGEPIPLIFCESCRRRTSTKVNAGWVAVPEKDLPVELPRVKNYQPTESGESPLANITKWVNTKCPKCKGKAKRETDTMPNWAGSSWYYLRYTDPKNSKEFAGKKNLEYWLGVDPAGGGVNWYNGGNEHTTLHLLYSRFWHKFLFDLKLVPTSEPYKKRTSHGMILGEGGVKMSKSLGNVINPDDIVKTYGADTLRIYEMFMGPFDQSVVWSTESIIGPRRFLEKVWNIGYKISKNQKNFSAPRVAPKKSEELNQAVQNSSGFLALEKLLHKTIKKVSEDIENMRFNTAISAMMILANEMEKANQLEAESYKLFLQLLSPFAPHITEEIWFNLGHKKSIHIMDWPKWNEDMIKEEEIKIVVQINGKVRTEIMIGADEREEDVKHRILKNEIVLKYTEGQNVKRVVYVKNRLINIVF
ncbi:MAG: class I tRNA ligase family protein [Candidatus Paceibacterota bacterium]